MPNRVVVQRSNWISGEVEDACPVVLIEGVFGVEAELHDGAGVFAGDFFFVAVDHTVANDSFRAEEFVDGTGCLDCAEGRGVIGPFVLDTACVQKGARSYEGHDEMLVEGYLVFVVVELGEVVIKPVWKTGVDALDCFLVGIAGDGRAARAGLMGYDQ